MRLAIDSLAAHRLAHPPQGIITGSRQESREEPVLVAPDLPWTECEFQEGVAYIRISFGVVVLAVRDLRFLDMHRQPAVPQSRRDGLHHMLRLLATAAIDHPVIGIAGKRAGRAGTLHPGVGGITHKQVPQDDAHHAALRRAALPGNAHSVLRFKQCHLPPFNIQENPAHLNVSAQLSAD